MELLSVFALVIDQSDILLLRRSLTTSRPGQWGLPGGGINPKESAVDAAIREVREEAGLDVLVSKELAVAGHSMYVQCNLAGSSRRLTLCTTECMDGSWCSPDRILEIGEVMDLTRVISKHTLSATVADGCC